MKYNVSVVKALQINHSDVLDWVPAIQYVITPVRFRLEKMSEELGVRRGVSCTPIIGHKWPCRRVSVILNQFDFALLICFTYNANWPSARRFHVWNAVGP